VSFIPMNSLHLTEHTCRACATGCGCHTDEPGCQHYGCYGTRPTRDCPGVAAEEARYAEACAARRAAEARILTRRARLAHSYRAIVLLGIIPR
jgi:hypothetical protein